MARWTATDIPHGSDKNVVITGANSGLGFITALELARHGYAVIMACRDMRKAAQASEAIQREVPAAKLTVETLDLASLASIGKFAETLKKTHSSLNILINNAGVMALPRRLTADGFEMQFGTNHLGHFALTQHLLPNLLSASAARIVTVSSQAHRMGKFDFADLQRESRYQKWLAYGQAKLANLLFAFELERRLRRTDTSAISVAAHPGYAATNLQMAGPAMENSRIGRRISEIANRFAAQPNWQGALPILYAATAQEVHGGGYYGPDGILEMRGYPREVMASDAAYDQNLATKLWEASEDLTHVNSPLS